MYSGLKYRFRKNLNKIGAYAYALALGLYNNNIPTNATFLNHSFWIFLDTRNLKQIFPLITQHRIKKIAIQIVRESVRTYILEEFLQFNTTPPTVLHYFYRKEFELEKSTIEKVPCPRLPIIGKIALSSDENKNILLTILFIPPPPSPSKRVIIIVLKWVYSFPNNKLF